MVFSRTQYLRLWVIQLVRVQAVLMEVDGMRRDHSDPIRLPADESESATSAVQLQDIVDLRITHARSHSEGRASRP